MSLISRVLLLTLALPFVLAGGGSCGDGQFRWGRKDCCLPDGGPSNPPSPPSGKDCPNNWSWNHRLGCCAPHSRPRSNSPPPQCSNGWNWSDNTLCCNPPPTPPNPSNPSSPSRKPGDCDDDNKGDPKGDDDEDNGDDDNNNNNKNNHGNNGRNGNGHKRFTSKKRQYRSRNVTPCPKGLSACPVSSLIGGDYECVDTLEDLDNCGGCSTLGEGQNCNAIPGVWNVACEQSACKIYTCADGYTLSQDGTSCNAL